MSAPRKKKKRSTLQEDKRELVAWAFGVHMGIGGPQCLVKVEEAGGFFLLIWRLSGGVLLPAIPEHVLGSQDSGMQLSRCPIPVTRPQRVMETVKRQEEGNRHHRVKKKRNITERLKLAPNHHLQTPCEGTILVLMAEPNLLRVSMIMIETS